MKLLKLCQPLFLQVCQYNRLGRLGVGLQLEDVRNRVKTTINKISDAASADPQLKQQFELLRSPVVFCVDSLFASNHMPFAKEWNDRRLAPELLNDLSGDEKFFDLLDRTLADHSEAASERLAVFFVCLGLGFKGDKYNNPQFIKEHINLVSPRVKQWMDPVESDQITPEAYKYTVTTDLTRGPGHGLTIVTILFVAILSGLLYFYYQQYREAKGDIPILVEKIRRQANQGK